MARENGKAAVVVSCCVDKGLMPVKAHEVVARLVISKSYSAYLTKAPGSEMDKGEEGDVKED